MYSVVICSAIGLLFGFGGCLAGLWPWGWAIFFTLVVFVAAWIVTARLVGKRLQPIMTRIQQQMQAGMVDAGMQGLRELLGKSHWMPMLRGQILAQMGMLAYQTGDHDEARKLLQQSSRRVADGQLVLAVMQYRAGDKALAFQTLQLSAAVNRKHSLLHNVWAWLLHQESRVDEAIAVLARYTKKQAIDETAKDNLLRLQNGQKLNMKSLGLIWYALGFERPPAEMGQLRQGRKGFRTPPMRRGGS